MEPILKWQYDQMVKQLLLLQEHETNRDCPCNSAGEMCDRKHLMTIEAYAEETLAMDSDEGRQEMLQLLADEARERREREEKALCGEDVPEDLSEWCRHWRKELESVSLVCETEQSDS
jgi:hypothetical protein